MSVGISADVAAAGRQPESTGGGRMSVVIVPVATVGCSDRADGPGVVSILVVDIVGAHVGNWQTSSRQIADSRQKPGC
jgi:hypothetical protein